ncbi:MAG: Spy/CpxP family protein refolding chaperone [Gammaproteobacteria bacterium]|nr:Spy/CpxP family protein refolding chaperone [Gammaproteobacteria bacterium]
MLNALSKPVIVFVCLLIISMPVWSDAPLKGKLGLDSDQASQVREIKKKYRQSSRSKRQELHREKRKLRRARNANDSQAIAELEPVVQTLKSEFQQIRNSENNEIRRLLTPEQNQKFDQVLQQRRAMVGSSRDNKDLEKTIAD